MAKATKSSSHKRGARAHARRGHGKRTRPSTGLGRDEMSRSSREAAKAREESTVEAGFEERREEEEGRDYGAVDEDYQAPGAGA